MVLPAWFAAPSPQPRPLCPFFFTEAVLLCLSLIIFKKKKNQTVHRVSLKSLCKVHFNHET